MLCHAGKLYLEVIKHHLKEPPHRCVADKCRSRHLSHGHNSLLQMHKITRSEVMG